MLYYNLSLTVRRRGKDLPASPNIHGYPSATFSHLNAVNVKL